MAKFTIEAYDEKLEKTRVLTGDAKYVSIDALNPFLDEDWLLDSVSFDSSKESELRITLEDVKFEVKDQQGPYWLRFYDEEDKLEDWFVPEYVKGVMKHA